MKNRQFLLILMLVVPWLTVPFLGRDALKKFLPNAIFITILNKLLNVYGVEHKWWRHYRGIGPFVSIDFVLLGPYFVTSMWVLKLAYGQFWKYFITNKIIHISFIFVGLKFLQKVKLFSLIKITKLQYFLIHITRGLILYLFQVIYDKLQKPKLPIVPRSQ